MHEMRFFCQSTGALEIYGMSTTLLEFQIVHYSVGDEQKTGNGFSMSEAMRAWYKEMQYSYCDLDLKKVVAIVRNVGREAVKKLSQ